MNRPRLATLAIVAVNLAPVVGVVALRWSMFNFLLYSWAETALLAVATLAGNSAKILRDETVRGMRFRILGLIGHLLWAPLFAGLYGFVALIAIGFARPGIDRPSESLRFALESFAAPTFALALVPAAIRFARTIVWDSIRGPAPRDVRAAREFAVVLARMVAIMSGVTVAVGASNALRIPYLHLPLMVLPKMGLELYVARGREEQAKGRAAEGATGTEDRAWSR